MPDSRRFQLGNVLTISFAHLLHDIFSSFLSPLLPLLIQKLSLGYSLAGLLSFIQRVPALANPLVGLMADKISIRYFIIISPSLTSVAMSLLGSAPHYVFLVILCLTMGISAVLFHVPAPVMVRRVSGKRTGKGMSYYMVGGELARSLGPIIILGAVSLWGLEGTYRLIPFGILTSLVLFFRFRRIRIADEFKKVVHRKDARREFFTHRRLFFLLAGFTASRALMKSALTAFLPIYLTARGSHLWLAGILLAALQLSGALGTLCCGTMSDFVGRKTMMLLIAAVTPLLMSFFLLSGGFLASVVLVATGFFLFAPNPVMLAMVQDTETGLPAFFNGIYMTINFFFGAVTNLLVGILGDLIGLTATYWLAAGLALFAVPCAVALKTISGVTKGEK